MVIPMTESPYVHLNIRDWCNKKLNVPSLPAKYLFEIASVMIINLRPFA